MICIHHNKDLDGYSSGAIIKKKYPNCTLIGWDYGNPIPKVPQGEEIIMIDISFPIDEMKKLGEGRQLTLIDHHISFKKEYDERVDCWDKFLYIYKAGVAACEIGWKFCFPEFDIPVAITLLGEYDTWRNSDKGRWENEILPFQFAMRTECTSPETFDSWLLSCDYYSDKAIVDRIKIGKAILKYQQGQDMLACERASFEANLDGHKGIFLNQGAFSSETLKTVFNPEKHQIMVGFQFNGRFWNVSLRSIGDIDVSIIAKSRGGGGHKNAAGFEAKSFEEIFEKK